MNPSSDKLLPKGSKEINIVAFLILFLFFIWLVVSADAAFIHI